MKPHTFPFWANEPLEEVIQFVFKQVEAQTLEWLIPMVMLLPRSKAQSKNNNRQNLTHFTPIYEFMVF